MAHDPSAYPEQITWTHRDAKARRVIAVDPNGDPLGSNLTNELGYTVADVTSVSASVTTVTLLAARVERRRVYVFNDSSSNMYIKLGPAASASSFTFFLTGQGGLELEPPCFIGEITAAWESATGDARVTEVATA